MHRHTSIYSSGCWFCRFADWIDKVDWRVEKSIRALRRLITGKEE